MLVGAGIDRPSESKYLCMLNGGIMVSRFLFFSFQIQYQQAVHQQVIQQQLLMQSVYQQQPSQSQYPAMVCQQWNVTDSLQICPMIVRRCEVAATQVCE